MAIVDEYRAIPLASKTVTEKGILTDRRLQVFFTARPKIDHHRLARAFVNLASTPEGRKLYEEIQAEKVRKKDL